MERLTMKIDGMTCGNCVAHVTKALKALDGVSLERVSIGAATVAFDPDMTSPDRIRSVVEEEGYAVASTSP